MLSKILLIPESKTNIKLTKAQENFLLFLLKNHNPLAKDLIKDLKIPKEKILELIKKEPKEVQKEILKFLKDIGKDSNIHLKNKLSPIKTNNKTDKESTQKEIEKISNVQEIINFLSQKIPQNTQTSKIQPKEKTHIVEIIKKEILSKNELKNFITTQKEIKQFKEIKTFKELIAFANQKGLNLKSIKISKTTKEKIISIINNSQQPIIHSKIAPKIIFHKKTIQNTKEDIKQPKSIITQLITPKKIKQTSNENPKITKTTTNAKIQTQKLENENIKNEQKNPIDIKTSPKETTKKEDHKIIQPQPNLTHTVKQNIIKAKESIKHFSNNLKEAIENYKPPISKVSLELHPKELGKVEVTIVHRGENLQIKINGQNQTINFFNTHQQELKNTLVNMGFSEINMSFNQNQNNQQHHKHQQYKQTQNLKEEDEFIIEIPYQYA